MQPPPQPQQRRVEPPKLPPKFLEPERQRAGQQAGRQVDLQAERVLPQRLGLEPTLELPVPARFCIRSEKGL